MKSFVKRNWICLTINRVCFASMALSIPVITAYWESLGLKTSGGYILEIVFAMGLVVLEVATGKLSDVFGRKACLIAAGITGALGALSYAVAEGFRGLVVAELLFALSIALNSGTEEALLYESYEIDKKNGLIHDHSFRQSWKLLFKIGFWSMVPCSALAGYLFAINPRMTWWILVTLMLIRSVSTCFIMETYAKPEKEEEQTGHIKQATRLLFCSCPDLRWITLVIAVIAGINQTAVWSYTPQFQREGWSLVSIGWVFAAFHVIAGLSAVGKESAKAQTTSEVFAWILALGTATTLGFVSLGLASSAWIVLAAAPQQWVRGGLTWIFSDYYQSRTPDHIRASVGSVRSAVGLLMYSVLMLPYVMLIDHVGRTGMLLGVGVVSSLLLGILFGFIRARSCALGMAFLKKEN
ncbi:MAG: hypothetical protein KDD62_11930 [Bdellovibrionales bacterium]|nr:hypothetical protein [Bdellovibrionales bacterium]